MTGSSRTGTSSCSRLSDLEASLDPRLEAWLAELLRTPGLTAVADPLEARRVHVCDALAALPLIERGPVVDVGSGGGSPGLPLAAALPGLRVDLLEPSRRKCEFLRAATTGFADVSVVCARAEHHGCAEGRDAYAVAVARALAPPAVAAEWCLPLVEPGGLAILYAGRPEVELGRVAAALAASGPEEIPVPGSTKRRLLVFRKLASTPSGFPRRVGVARKRPLA